MKEKKRELVVFKNQKTERERPRDEREGHDRWVKRRRKRMNEKRSAKPCRDILDAINQSANNKALYERYCPPTAVRFGDPELESRPRLDQERKQRK